MAYIGDKPSQTLASPTSQYFNGDGSTVAFTLNRAVNVAEDLEVFVNNVQQEPGVGKSYTATGTTLTFDAAPSAGTANVYVVYRGLAEVTTRLEHDPNAALAATTGTFSGDLTVDTNTLYVDSTNNNVGIGTTSPDGYLHVHSSSAGTVTAATDANQLVLESTANVGMSFLTGNTATTRIKFGDPDANNSGVISYVHSDDSMRFNTGGSEAMRIDSSGNLLVGTTTSGGTVDGLQLGADNIARFTNTSSVSLILNRVTSDGSLALFRKDNTTVGSISVTGSSTAYNTSSDYRLKQNVTATWDATTRLKQLNPVRFNFIADADTTVDGFLAHEVQSVVPEAVTGAHDEVDDDGNPVYQGIDQSKLVPLLVKTIQELEARIVALENA